MIPGIQTGIIRITATARGGLIHHGTDQDGASASVGAAGIQVCTADTGILIIGARAIMDIMAVIGTAHTGAEVTGTTVVIAEVIVLWAHVQPVMEDAARWAV